MKILLLLVCLFELHAAYYQLAELPYKKQPFAEPYRRKRSARGYNGYAYPYAQDQSSLSVPEDAVYRRKRSDDLSYTYTYVPEDATYRRKRSDDYAYTYAYAQDQSSYAPHKRAAEQPAVAPYAYPYAQDQSSIVAHPYRRKRSDNYAYAYAQDQSSRIPGLGYPYRRKRSDDYTYYANAQDQSSIVSAKRVAPTKRAAEQPDDATAVDGHGYEYQYQYAHPVKRAAELPYYAFPAGYEYMPTYAHHAKRAAEQPAVKPYFLPQYEYIGGYYGGYPY